MTTNYSSCPAALASAFFLIAGLRAAPSALGGDLEIDDLTESSAMLRFAGDHGGRPGIEISEGLGTWLLAAEMVPDDIVAPTEFTFEDRSVLYRDGAPRFYRVNRRPDEAALDWMRDYPGEYPDGEEADPIPLLMWARFRATIRRPIGSRSMR
ncbi:MAG: hypothetical protein R3F11_08515 [Verrucomicrobiales bacterium]